MDKKYSIFDYLAQTFMIFGINVLLLNMFCLLFGESAKGYSTIFSLGGSGLSIATMMQFLLLIAILTFFRFLFMTDRLIKRLSIVPRIIFLFAAAFISTVIFVVLFGWFPVDVPVLWVMFIVCFGISCGASTFISYLKEKSENKKLEEALRKNKERFK